MNLSLIYSTKFSFVFSYFWGWGWGWGLGVGLGRARAMVRPVGHLRQGRCEAAHVEPSAALAVAPGKG